MNHPLSCQCGKLKGSVSHPKKGNRAVCYCKDCQAYAHFLGKPQDILDEWGGTDIIATQPHYVSFSQGAHVLTCICLTPKGPLRWYASCCNTPIGNTARTINVAYVGLLHSCLESTAQPMERSFGPIGLRLNRESAKSRIEAIPWSTFKVMPRLIASALRARFNGNYKQSPFFDPAQGTPVAPPKTLSAEERAQWMRAAIGSIPDIPA